MKVENDITLPTKRVTLIVYNNQNDCYMYGFFPIITTECEYHHIYVTSDDEIKVNDFIKCPYGVEQVAEVTDIGYFCVGNNFHFSSCRKIIKTTDTRLKSLVHNNKFPEDGVYMNLPQPSLTFIKKWIKEYNKDYGDNIIKDSWNKEEYEKGMRLAFQAGNRRGYCERSIMGNIGATCDEPDENKWIKNNIKDL